MLWDLLMGTMGYVAGVLFSCGLGSIRFVMGVSIVSYWGLKIIGALGGVSGIVGLIDRVF